MSEIYKYMKERLKEFYESNNQTVELDMAHFFQLYKIVCDMTQIQNITKQYED